MDVPQHCFIASHLITLQRLSSSPCSRSIQSSRVLATLHSLPSRMEAIGSLVRDGVKLAPPPCNIFSPHRATRPEHRPGVHQHRPRTIAFTHGSGTNEVAVVGCSSKGGRNSDNARTSQVQQPCMRHPFGYATSLDMHQTFKQCPVFSECSHFVRV